MFFFLMDCVVKADKNVLPTWKKEQYALLSLGHMKIFCAGKSRTDFRFADQEISIILNSEVREKC